MLALADDAALARVLIAATGVPRCARSRWLRDLARTTEAARPDISRTRKALPPYGSRTGRGGADVRFQAGMPREKRRF